MSEDGYMRLVAAVLGLGVLGAVVFLLQFVLTHWKVCHV